MRLSFTGAVFVYVAAILVGVGVIYQRVFEASQLDYVEVPLIPIFPPRIHYLAVSSMPAQHRLRARDLTVPDGIPPMLEALLPEKNELIGHYLKNAVSRGCAIHKAELSERPVPLPAVGKHMISLPLFNNQHLVNLLSPGSRVDVCVGDTCELRGCVVLAVDCHTIKVEQCEVLLELSQEELDKLEKVQRKDNWELVVQPTPRIL